MFVVEHQRTAVAHRVELPVFQEFDILAGLTLDETPGDAKIARHTPEREVGHRTQDELLRDREIPSDADRTHQAVPLHRHRSLLRTLAEDEHGIVAAERGIAFKIERERLAPGETAAKLRQEHPVGAAFPGADRKGRAGHIGGNGVLHHGQSAIHALLQVGAGHREIAPRRSGRKQHPERKGHRKGVPCPHPRVDRGGSIQRFCISLLRPRGHAIQSKFNPIIFPAGRSPEATRDRSPKR